MKDYSELSNFEINKAVADIATNGTWHLEPSHPNNTTGGWLYGSNGIQTYPMPDYCNNPADAWPIIVENRISLNWSETEKSWCAHVGGVMTEGCWCWDDDPSHHHDGSNPLRAAMVTFLMMKDRESGHAKTSSV